MVPTIPVASAGSNEGEKPVLEAGLMPVSYHTCSSPVFRLLAAALLLILLLPATGSALSFESGGVPPGEPLLAAQNVSIGCTIRYDATSGAESMDFFTDLDSARWIFTITRNGAGTPMAPRFGRYESLTGFELYYPGSVTRIDISLAGKAPANPGTITLLRVRQFDTGGESAKDELAQNVRVVTEAEIDAAIAEAATAVAALRTQIDTADSEGIPVAAAEAAYSRASENLTAAAASLSGAAWQAISRAADAAAEGQGLLAQAYAEALAADAREEITDVRMRVDTEGGTWSAERRMVIEAKLEAAETLLVRADAARASGAYDEARLHAGAAREKAAEAVAYADEAVPEESPVTPATTGPTITETPAPAGASGDIDAALEGVDRITRAIRQIITALSELAEGLQGLMPPE
ncbi:MAG: hypothetical protein APR53_07390 [Methanoculleus sp. SDB]|nr:MAG: hypothetical protein APR53_07390 [Methanoculleus sp. SDB]